MVKSEWRSYLRKLGRTPGIIAKNLLKEDCKGSLKNGNDCPLFWYLMKAFLEKGRHRKVKVDGAWAYITEIGGERLDLSLHLHQGLAKFVMRFDEGKYPELIREGAKPDDQQSAGGQA